MLTLTLNVYRACDRFTGTEITINPSQEYLADMAGWDPQILGTVQEPVDSVYPSLAEPLYRVLNGYLWAFSPSLDKLQDWYNTGLFLLECGEMSEAVREYLRTTLENIALDIAEYPAH